MVASISSSWAQRSENVRRPTERGKQLEEIRQERNESIKTRALKFGVIAVAAVAAVIAIAWVGGAFSGDDDTLSTTGDTIETFSADATVPDDTSTADSVPAETIPEVVVPLPDPPADPSDCPDGTGEPIQSFESAPPLCIDPEATYTAVVGTSEGDYTIELDAAVAPTTVNNFVYLANNHYFDDTVCHRIIADFMTQCGDPTGTGSGGPGYSIPDELAGATSYSKGTIAMANAGPDTGGSQFFVVTGDDVTLPPAYSVFGHVTDGLDDTLAALNAQADPSAANGVPPLAEVKINSITITGP